MDSSIGIKINPIIPEPKIFSFSLEVDKQFNHQINYENPERFKFSNEKFSKKLTNIVVESKLQHGEDYKLIKYIAEKITEKFSNDNLMSVIRKLIFYVTYLVSNILNNNNKFCSFQKILEEGKTYFEADLKFFVFIFAVSFSTKFKNTPWIFF